MSGMTIIPPGVETAAQYHSSGAWGSTLIGHFLRSPRLARLIHTGVYRPKPTAAMQFGSAFHEFMDPGGNFAGLYRIGPDVDHRTKAWKEAVAVAEKDGVTLLAADDLVELQAMRESVMANPVAAHLIDGAEHEVGFRMPSGFGDFTIQCRADVFRRGRWISDLKTCPDLDDFAGSVKSRGYYRQAALYRHIINAATGQWLPFTFITVEKTAPLYRCRVVELDEEYLSIGWREVEEALIEIGRRTSANDWDDHHHAEVLGPPSWLLRSQPLSDVA